MNICEPFIRRPVMTALVTAAIALFGWMAYERLPVSDLPNTDSPTISVYASLPGASAETMASAIATPLEQQFASIAGIGLRVFPYRLYVGRPVRRSRKLRHSIMLSYVSPRTPCCGPKAANKRS